MSLKDKINSEMVVAAKAKDALKLGAIRMIKTALHNKEIDAKRELNESEILQVLSAIVKQRKDSIEQFKAGKRQDLVDKEESELAVVQAFMPQQMSPEEVESKIVRGVVHDIEKPEYTQQYEELIKRVQAAQAPKPAQA